MPYYRINLKGYCTQIGGSRLWKSNNFDIEIYNASCRTASRRRATQRVSRSPFFSQTKLGIRINKTWTSIGMCSVLVNIWYNSFGTLPCQLNIVTKMEFMMTFLQCGILNYSTFYYTISVDTCIVIISFPAIVSIMRQRVFLLKGCISLK